MHHRLVRDGRIAALIVLMLILLSVYAYELYQLQIIEGEKYYNQSNEITTEERPITAARGNILDRYGRVLVSNTEVYNLTIDTTKLFANEDPNETILGLVNMVEGYGDTYTDDLPITSEPPFEYDPNMTEIQRTMLKAYIEDKKDDLKALAVDPDNPTAVELMSYMRTRYSIDNSYSAQEMRIIAGVRYSINVRYAINTADYVFVENASMKLITSIMENKLSGINVNRAYKREYGTDYAAHILGYVGLMTQEEYEKYSLLKYSTDAYVGKDGVEYAFEEYLHGVDGEAEVYSNLDGVTLRTKYTKEPQPGGHVYLTLDIGLQEVCEEALAAHIESINEDRARIIAEAEMYGTESTEMISGGALCVVKVDTGEPLALVSYPTYDAATMLDNYETLVADENAPLYNRALMGVYAPGSTFKPCTATALLAEGIISPTRTLKTEGQFTKYIDDGYAPECWIYSTYKYTHGEINVVQAITYSCNYFFYYFGDELGIDKMAYYAKLYGLGEHTGIELPEVTGQMSTQSFKEQYTGISWFQGDTLQSAIGQSFTEFTPLQMAEYCAAIANGGTRHSASILKEVRSYDYSKTLFQRETEVLSKLDIDPEIFGYIQYGMYGVLYDAASTLKEHWLDSSIVAAAKTGTAQRGEGLVNNAMFILYAPYGDNPEIAIAIAVEKGGAGATLSPVARKIVDYYFTFQSSANTVENAYSLLK